MFNFMKQIGKVISYIRAGLANTFFILFLIIIIVAIAGSPGQEPIPKKAALHISMSGYLVDKATYEPSVIDFLTNNIDKREIVVRDLVYAINAAAKDERVTALAFDLSPMVSGGISKIEEIGQAVENFKSSGKPVYAYADNYSQQQYLLATYADDIYLNEMGTVALTGFGIYRNYYKDAADKLSVKFHVFRVGQFKDAVEPFIRNSMSDASRKHNSVWLNDLWNGYVSQIETSRKLESGSVAQLIDNIEERVADKTLSLGQLALNAGLVDKLVTRNAMNQMYIEKFGEGKTPGTFKGIHLNQYLADIKPMMPSDENNIGLIVAQGTIVDGDGTAAEIGSHSLRKLIRQAANDKSLKALVIRVDSGGGSAFASEVIRDEIAVTREKGLPVYISMGSVAASGGYWISTNSNEIWATPSTITGSIGVFGLIPNLTDSFDRLGIHSDGIGTTELADVYQVNRPMSDKAKAVFQSSVDNIYVKFLNLVSNAREMPVDDVHEIAQGRVWIGSTALELGLVDKLGSLNDLFVYVAEKHEIGDYHVKAIRPPLSTMEQIMLALQDQVRTAGHDIVAEYLPQLQAVRNDPAVEDLIKQTNAESPVKFFAKCLICRAP